MIVSLLDVDLVGHLYNIFMYVILTNVFGKWSDEKVEIMGGRNKNLTLSIFTW